MVVDDGIRRLAHDGGQVERWQATYDSDGRGEHNRYQDGDEGAMRARGRKRSRSSMPESVRRGAKAIG